MPREERIYSVFIVVSDFIVFFFWSGEGCHYADIWYLYPRVLF